MKEVCEKDKSAKLQIPVSRAVLALRNNKMWFNHSSNATGNSNSKAADSEIFNISPSGSTSSKHCRAFTRAGAYIVFLCKRDVCGVDRLVLLRKKKAEGSGKTVTNKKTGKTRQPQVDSLMSMQNGMEEVNVDHVYIADVWKAELLQYVRQRCKEALGTVDGGEEGRGGQRTRNGRIVGQEEIKRHFQ